jgi:hypothetical protein
MSRISWKAIALGALVAIVGITLVLGILHAASGWRWVAGLPPTVVGNSVGFAFSFIGGLVAARLARRRELLHAVATAVPFFLLGLDAPMESMLLMLSLAGMFLSALLGGFCGRQWNRSSTV